MNLKENQLRDLATCQSCRRKIGETNMPMLHVVRLERHILDGNAIQRQAGLEQMLGGEVALAQAMGPDEDMTQQVDSAKCMICEDCMLEHAPWLMMAYESPGDEEE